MIAALIAFVTTAALTPIVIFGGRRLKVLDAPGGRKHHAVFVPRAGGIAVVAGLVAASSAAFMMGIPEVESGALNTMLPLIVATAVMFAVGLLDDIRGCSVRVKIVVQAVAGILVVVFGSTIDLLSEPIGLVHVGTAAGSVLAILWLMGIANAINFIDGLDGLAVGAGAMIAASLAICAGLNGDRLSVVLALAMCGSCAGFLPYNWRPARIFLGDSGSLTIGFVLGWLSLINALQADTTAARAVPPLLLAVPTIDALLVIQHRFTEKAGVGIQARVCRAMQADRHHLHHRLLAVAEDHIVVLVIHALVAINCAMALIALVAGSLLLVAITLLIGIVVLASLRGSAHRKLGSPGRLAGNGARFPNAITRLRPRPGEAGEVKQ